MRRRTAAVDHTRQPLKLKSEQKALYDHGMDVNYSISHGYAPCEDTVDDSVVARAPRAPRAPVSLQADCQADQVQQQWHRSSGAERSPFVGTLGTLGTLGSVPLDCPVCQRDIFGR